MKITGSKSGLSSNQHRLGPTLVKMFNHPRETGFAQIFISAWLGCAEDNRVEVLQKSELVDDNAVVVLSAGKVGTWCVFAHGRTT